ncbi:MAG: prepilin-type N-terminal cleavage/methylation domain-containing protein [Desulfamplus sp.]|nr:prepilin-type N-terminal cleavage/methylation domain-containing protein [Desulfamplus sp.]
MKILFQSNAMRSNSAFTLIEIMVVIGIIAIISAIAIPNLMNPEHKLKSAATGLMGDIQKTRSMAIKTNTTWGIWFDKANNRYIISSYTGKDEAWSKIDTDGSQPIEKEVVFSGNIAGVQYGHGAATKTVTGNTSFPKEETTYSSEVLTFDSKGVCSAAVSGYGYRYVYLEHGELTYAVGTGATGIVRLFRWDGKKWQ